MAGVGVLLFSFSFPATDWALSGFGPWTTVGLRGTGAGLIALVAIRRTGGRLPSRDDLPGLLVVAGGCAIGFPVLSTLALQTSSTADSAVVVGALPIATAAIATLRTRERHSPGFWAAALVGAGIELTFALSRNHGLPPVATLCLVGAVIICAAGYAEGGRLAGHMPSWQVIAWGVLLAAPVNLLIASLGLATEPLHPGTRSIAALLFLAGVSQFGGYIVWYRGMGLIGVARASQLQLAQPLLTVAWSVLLLSEQLSAAVPLTAAAVLVCIVVSQRAPGAGTGLRGARE